MRARRSLFAALSLPFVFALGGLFAGSGARGAEPPRSRCGQDPIDAFLMIVAPREYKLFSIASAKGANLATADAMISLVNETHRVILAYNKANPDYPRTKDHLTAQAAYIFAWERAIQIWKRTDDDAARAKIMAAWNAGLTETPEVEYQLEALVSEWHPAFMTDAFIKLYLRTNDISIIGSCDEIFGDYGQDAEESLLKQKRGLTTGKSTAEERIVRDIDFALKKIGYWRKGDKGRFGPAAAPNQNPVSKP